MRGQAQRFFVYAPGFGAPDGLGVAERLGAGGALLAQVFASGGVVEGVGAVWERVAEVRRALAVSGEAGAALIGGRDFVDGQDVQARGAAAMGPPAVTAGAEPCRGAQATQSAIMASVVAT